MKKIILATLYFIMACMLCSGQLSAQEAVPGAGSKTVMDTATDDVHLFQFYFRDAQVSASPYAEAGMVFSDFDKYDFFSIDTKGGFPLNEQIEFGAAFDLRHVDPDVGSSESGISDLLLTGRYLFKNTGIKNTDAAAGLFITIPSGDKDVYQDHFNTGAFGAFRHKLTNSVTLTANIGLDYIEVTDARGDDDREVSFVTGFGAICMVTDELALVGEFGFKSEVDYIMLTGGADYKLLKNGRIRSSLGFGLDDDGSPDLMFTVGYQYLFSY